jgi:hypothetical protein
MAENGHQPRFVPTILEEFPNQLLFAQLVITYELG